jgi:hypothetical protein
VVFLAPSNVSAQAVDAMARRLGLVPISSQNLTLSDGTLFHFRIDNGRQVSDVVRELEGENNWCCSAELSLQPAVTWYAAGPGRRTKFERHNGIT